MPRKYAYRSGFRMPAYRRHKASNRGGIQFKPVFGDAFHYLPGAWKSPESLAALEAAYDKIEAHYLAQRRASPTPVPKPEPNVNDVALAFLDWATTYYGGTRSPHFVHFRIAARLLKAHYGETPAAQFGPLALKAVRQAMIEKDWSRGYANQQTNRIRRIFRWAVENELCDGTVLANLQAVSGLRKGKTKARETAPVRPVEWRSVKVVLPFLPRLLRIAVRVQWRSGMRSDELMGMRPCDIGNWIYTPPSHKTAWQGKLKRICLGPRVQKLLSLCTPPAPEDYYFSPAAVMRERNATRAAKRRSKVYGAAKTRKPRRVQRRYSSHAYQHAINHAFKALAKSLGHERPAGAKLIPWLESVGIEHWHPHRLRHSRATILRAKYGIEAAQAVLGNSLEATQIYAEKSLALAIRVARETG